LLSDAVTRGALVFPLRDDATLKAIAYSIPLQSGVRWNVRRGVQRSLCHTLYYKHWLLINREDRFFFSDILARNEIRPSQTHQWRSPLAHLDSLCRRIDGQVNPIFDNHCHRLAHNTFLPAEKIKPDVVRGVLIERPSCWWAVEN